MQAQSGSYARNTTYTILTANGGLSGSYTNVTSNFAFLTPSLAYDANNVYLSLFLNQSAFAAGAQTPTSSPSARCSTRPGPAPPATSTRC